MENITSLNAGVDLGSAPGCPTTGLPVTAYQPYIVALRGVMLLGETETTLVFEAERDTVFTDLSVGLIGNGAVPIPPGSSHSIEYCNTILAEDTDNTEFNPCCQRKPFFFSAVRENKRLKIVVRAYTPVTVDTMVLVGLSGFQGSGCC